MVEYWLWLLLFSQGGHGHSHGYNTPCHFTSFPTLYIQQDPTIYTTSNALSTLTNTDTYSTISAQVYVNVSIPTTRGETHNNVGLCEIDMMNHTFTRDTVVYATN